MKPRPTITVVIPTRNAGPTFEAVLERVRMQAITPRPRLLIVDSGSTDGTASLARRHADRVLPIQPRSFDHGATRALALREAESELVAFLVQDALPADEDWLAPLADAFEDPQVAGAYSRQLPAEGGSFFVVDRLSRSPVGGPERRRHAIGDRWAFERLPPAERMTGCTFDDVASCVRRRVALEIGFRKIRFGEDVDWARRALAAGHAIVYEPSSRVHHSHGRGSGYELRRAYLGHQLLRRQFELRAVPTARDVVRGALREQRRLSALIRACPGLPARRRLALACGAFPYALSQTLGAWLGAHSASGLRDGRRIYRLLDRLLSGGV